jgi:hypothetical protein
MQMILCTIQVVCFNDRTHRWVVCEHAAIDHCECLTSPIRDARGREYVGAAEVARAIDASLKAYSAAFAPAGSNRSLACQLRKNIGAHVFPGGFSFGSAIA